MVGNPPYITPKDKAQNEAYRRFYNTCHRQYSLGVPFTQRFWELAIGKGERVKENGGAVSSGAGYVGMITANSFMKREFGKKLIEEFFPKIDLTHVIDTSGAYIPGHGTPTVILFGRARKPVGETVRAVLGIKGEPATPEDPALGLVWQSIVKQIDIAGAQDDYTSTADVQRTTFASHPWSIGGGGTAELKERLEEEATGSLEDEMDDLGRTTHTGEDEVFFVSSDFATRQSLESFAVTMVTGDDVRDWRLSPKNLALFPYDQQAATPIKIESPDWQRHFWTYRVPLRHRKDFGNYIEERGLRWFDHSMFFPTRYRAKLVIAFAVVATHNHFVLDRGGKVFNRHAPIIKLPADATEDENLALLGLLNSSTACFWMKQTFHNKGSTVDQRGARQRTDAFEDFYEFTGTGLQRFPLPENCPITIAKHLDDFAQQRSNYLPDAVCRSGLPNAENLASDRNRANAILALMIAMQEELDWQCYTLYGLIPSTEQEPLFIEDFQVLTKNFDGLQLGQRAFEIVMARQMEKGELQTTWFQRHSSTPITEIPKHWPASYRTLVERRIKLIETNKEIGLIERPEFKRRWNTEPWAEQEQRALRNCLLDRLETPRYWPVVELQSAARLADRARADAEFMQVAALYRGRPDFNVAALVAELVESESVPFLPILRYKSSGLRKRELWERTWDLQRKEDAREKVGDIPVPPKFASADFQKTDYWRLRDKLDVPKERWVSYPHCQTDSDPSLVVGWAGWNHLQQARP